MGSRLVLLGRELLQVAGAELAVGVSGLNCCRNESLDLTVLLLSYGCTAVAEPHPWQHLLGPSQEVKSSVHSYCSPWSLLLQTPAAVGFQLN